MRRILFPLLVIGLAGGLFTLGSGAFFSDVESDTGNTITAGTVDLALGTTVGVCDYTAAAPGATLSPACTKTLNLAGSLNDLYLAVELGATPAACTTGGANDSTEHCDANADLTASLIEVTACSFNAGACPFATALPATLAALITEGCVALDTDADASEDGRVLSLTFRVASTAGNTAQGDAISVDFQFGLTQASDTPADRCNP